MGREVPALESNCSAAKSPTVRCTTHWENDMSTTTWTQYVAMDDGILEPGMLDAALESLEDWDDDFEIGAQYAGEPPDDLDDPE